MKHINSIAVNGMKKSGKIGCGECQSSCQSQSELQEQRRKSQHRQKAVAVRG